ncbi:OLC1v1008416C1 [Oldenlandia corymbosa var. corymbosa]|nr:OLC1v1008416C1 [Oldenlandia corymbosa var. corymbosa]
MLDPKFVAQAMSVIAANTDVPVSVKCRIGVDDHDSYNELCDFIYKVSSQSPTRHFIIHSRKALLNGLSPAENRKIPPLKYEYYYALLRDFPDLRFTINGGINTVGEVNAAIAEGAHGVMLGRAAYNNPWQTLGNVDSAVYGEPHSSLTRRQVLEKYQVYGDSVLGKYDNRPSLRDVVKPLLGLFHSEPRSALWKRKVDSAFQYCKTVKELLEETLVEIPDYVLDSPVREVPVGCLDTFANSKKLLPPQYSRWEEDIVMVLTFPLESEPGSYSSNKPDVEGEALMEFLTALNDSNHRLNWNYYFVSPCFSWSNVTCINGNVVSLNLASNGFSGTLSPAITKLKFLVNLDLHDNDLSGDLPDYLGSMLHLQNLNLAKNKFTGPIPTTWGQLTNLKHLVVKENNLSGSIPDSLAGISSLMQLDLSSNDLSGKVPVQLFSLPMFNFSDTHLTCGEAFQQPCVSSSLVAVSSKKRRVEVIITGVACGTFVLLVVGAALLHWYHKVRNPKREVFVDVEGEDDSKISFGQLQRFSWREIQMATENFNEANVIGQGGFGKVYKGFLPDNTKVAVKRLSDYHNPGGEAAFLREVQLISVAVHKNLLRLIGFCTTSSERILVYPFMQNLSVAYRLRELKPGEKGLDWPTRKRIAFGTAHGLEYLHEHCNPKIIHRDLKAANILLDDDFEAVLGDFGLAKLVDNRLTHITTQVRGTMGHIAPEYLSTGKSSEKTDVFGYGITLLELVSGQRAIDFSRLEEEEDVLLLDHTKKLLREKRIEDIVDRNLNSYNAKEVETILQVALLCTQGSPEDRPRMAEVVNMLQGVGLTERWSEWEKLEEVRNQEFSLVSHSHQFLWADESTQDQEAIQLSQAR